MGTNLAILGGGNIGMAIAGGLVRKGGWPAERIRISRRDTTARTAIGALGFQACSSTAEALEGAALVLLCVQPAQCPELLDELAPLLQPTQTLVSVVTGLSVAAIKARVGERPVVRAMPNTAITLGESMTCLAADAPDRDSVEPVRTLFDSLGSTRVIKEELMGQATALCACGVAFFLRAIRAASQGGIEIGFHADEAIAMAAQTARWPACITVRTRWPVNTSPGRWRRSLPPCPRSPQSVMPRARNWRASRVSRSGPISRSTSEKRKPSSEPKLPYQLPRADSRPTVSRVRTSSVAPSSPSSKLA